MSEQDQPRKGTTMGNRTNRSRKSFAYSGLADAALRVGRLAALFGCVASVLHLVIGVIDVEIGTIVNSVLAFFLCLAVGVVFIRVEDI